MRAPAHPEPVAVREPRHKAFLYLRPFIFAMV